MNNIKLASRTNITLPRSNKQKLPSFTSKEDLINRAAHSFVKTQEDLKVTRFIQCEITNLTPKAVFARSIADISENAFLELSEASLFFFAPAVLGKFFRKISSKFIPKNLRDEVDALIPRSAEHLVTRKDEAAKRALSLKAAIILACTAIPAGEYALSFAKNLFTLHVFKKSDFNNVVNLNKEQKEDEKQQKRVKDSAHRHIKNAGLVSLGGLAASLVFAKFGHKSEVLQKASSLILQPGAHIANGLKKIGLHSEGFEKFLKKYITPDFDSTFNAETNKEELTLSKGQLLVSTLAGFFGYSAAGKDRGRLDQLEVWTRVPLVVFYTVFGSDLFEHVFKKNLIKHNKFSDLLKKDGNEIAKIPSLKEIKALAVKIAKEKGSTESAEYSRLVKEKAYIVGVPYLFTLLTMGFLLAGINRFWTQYRFNHLNSSDKDENKFKGFAQPKPLAFKNIG